jgi:hypothetical protein
MAHPKHAILPMRVAVVKQVLKLGAKVRCELGQKGSDFDELCCVRSHRAEKEEVSGALRGPGKAKYTTTQMRTRTGNTR